MRQNKKAFTLVEIVISLFILSMMALALGAATIQARKLSEAAVYHATALSAAQGYMEQIQSMEYQNLLDAFYAPTAAPLPTKLDQGTPDPLYINVENEKNVVVDVDASGNPSKSIKMKITPSLSNLEGTLGYKAMEITLLYEWRSAESATAHKRALRLVRSYVPTF